MRRLWAVALLSLALVVIGIPLSASASASNPTGPGSFTASGVDGGGFINVIAFDPWTPGVVLAGGDVSGISRSSDSGRTWQTSNAGIESLSALKIASLAFSPSTPGTIYAGVGFQGTGGGLLVSTDDGRSWSLRSTTPQFSGGNNPAGGPLPSPHPRSTGRLIAIDPGSGLLYAATYDDGVMRSADGGTTWTALGLAGQYLRSLAMDPQNSDVLYAATYGDAVWKTTTASTTGAFDQLTASPATAEDLVFIGSDLYAAAGTAGLTRSSDGGLTWSTVGGGAIPTNGPAWFSITGYDACGNQTLLLGGQLAGANSLLRSTDGGATWSSLTADPAGIHTTIGDASGPAWWLTGTNMLAGSTYLVADVEFDPASGDACTHPTILLAGRSGVWGTTDAGADWYPMVRSLGVTIVRALVADPNVPGRLYVAPADWGFLVSSDGGASVRRTSPSKVNDAFSLAVDAATTPSTVYLGAGQVSSNAGGEVWSNPDPAGAGAWTSQGLSAATGGKRPLAVAVNRVAGAPVILAAVEDSGIWRKAGGTWSLLSAAAMGAQTTKGASLSWPEDSSTAYLYDRESGVWRSTDAGSTWTRIWQQSSPAEMSGYVAADPANAGRLFVSVASLGLFRLDGAGAGAGTVEDGTITPVPIGGVAQPGPIAATSDGTLVVTGLVSAGTPPSVRSTSDGGTTWTTLSDASYASAGGFPRALAVGADGSVAIGLSGNGMLTRAGPPQQLSVSLAGTGAGTVTSSPAGIDCATTCSAWFDPATTVALAASPSAGSVFVGWSGDCGGSSTCAVSMTATRSVTATFEPGDYALSVSENGNGSGGVTSSPAGIDCGATCSATFASGTSVTLTAAPSSNSTFAGWGGACAGSSTSCVVVMDAARNVTASFGLASYPLSVSRSGTGSGTVTSSPSGIACGSACSATFVWGTSVTLTAAPSAGSTFAGWMGDCSGTATTCTVTVTTAMSVGARFDPIPAVIQPDAAVKLHAATAWTGDGVYSATGSGETLSVNATRSSTTTFDIALQNDGSVGDAFTISGPGATSRFQVKYYAGLIGSTDITSKVTSGTYRTVTLSPGATVYIRLVVTVKFGTPKGSTQSWLVTERSNTTTSIADGVGVTVNVV